MRGSRGDENRDDGDGEVDLRERVETLSDLLVAAGSDSINNEALEHFSQMVSSFNFADLPHDPQPYDQSVECLITVLDNCRSADEDAFGDQSSLPLPLRAYPESRSGSSRRRGKPSVSSIEKSSASLTTSKSIHQRENTELRLQEQFEKYKNSASRPKDGNSCSDTKPFSTSSVSLASKQPSTVGPLSPSKPLKRTSSKREVKLQDQFEKAYNKKTYPKIGPGHTDVISEISDLTMPTLKHVSGPEEDGGGESASF